MIIVGIDPGDSWCGFAALDISKYAIRAESRTYGRDDRNIFRMVETLLPFAGTKERVIVAVENFQIRGQGHQRFSAGDTLRLIGALEYVCIRYGWSFNLVPPGSWKADLPLLFGNHILTQYRKAWPTPGHANWDHCLSAWRVLGRHLLSEHLLSVLAPMRKAQRTVFWEQCAPWVHAKTRGYDLVAPAVRHDMT